MSEIKPLADLTWEVKSALVYRKVNDEIIESPRYKELYRDDSNEQLAIVLKTYSEMTNESLKNVAAAISSIAPSLTPLGFEEISSGRKMLIHIQSSENLVLKNVDIQSRMIIGNSNDYSSSFFVGCVFRTANGVSFGSVGKHFSVNHTKNKDARIENVVQYYEKYLSVKREMERKFESIANISVDSEVKDGLIQAALNIDGFQDLTSSQIEEVSSLLTSINRQLEIENSLFGAFVGAAEYVNNRHFKDSGDGNLFGTGASYLKRSLEFCTTIAE